MMKKNNKKKKNGDSALSRLPQRYTFAYIVLMIVVFPLFTGGNLASITPHKYAFFLAVSLLYFVLLIFALIGLAAIGEYRFPSPRVFWKNRSLAQKAVLLFALVCVLSTAFSPYPKEEVFFGPGGQEGLLTLLIYCGIFLAVSLYGTFRPWLIYLFAGSITIQSVIILLQRAGLNPFGLYPSGETYTDSVFVGTVGNVNYVSTLFCLALPVFVAGLFLLKDRLRFCLILPILLSVAVIPQLNTDSGLVGLAGCLLILVPLMMRSRKSRKIAWAGSAAVVVLGLLLLYFCDFGQKTMLYEAHLILHGQIHDSMGTGRIYLWRNSLPLILDYPILGSGPDTFMYRFMPDNFSYFGDTEIRIENAAHNEYLNLLINVGCWGSLAYLTVLASQITRTVKRCLQEPALLILFAGILTYLIQAFFNVCVFFVAPIFWIFLGLLEKQLHTGQEVPKVVSL